MGDSIRYPIMKSVKDAAEIYGLSPAYIRRLAELAKCVSSMQVTAGWSTWIALPDILKQATPARQGWMKPLAVSAGFLGGDILEHTEP